MSNLWQLSSIGFMTFVKIFETVDMAKGKAFNW